MATVNQEVQCIIGDEVRTAGKKMRGGKAGGPDDIPLEVWRCLEEMTMELLTKPWIVRDDLLGFLFGGLCLTVMVDHRCLTVVPDHSSSSQQTA